MNDQAHGPDSKISARRRLIRGAFAAPAALTLYSGSVAARSINNCVTRQVSATTPPTPAPSGMPDTFVRVQLQKFQKSTATAFPAAWSRWVRGFDVSSLLAAGQSVFVSGTSTTATNWYLYDKGTASAYAATALGTTIGTTPAEGTTIQSADQWVALRVNAAGDIVGVVGIGNTAATSAVYQSCWTSFRLG